MSDIGRVPRQIRRRLELSAVLAADPPKAHYPEQRVAQLAERLVPLSGVQLEGGEYGHTSS